MKVRLMTVLVLFTLSFLAFPYAGQAGHGHGDSGWYWAGGFLGGLFLGSALSGPYYAPRPVYVYPPPPIYAPPPVYAYPAPPGYHAYPNRGYSQPPAPTEQDDERVRGEWVEVPGQWVKGRWVPVHKAWIPFAP